jgi:hypothetical protein
MVKTEKFLKYKGSKNEKELAAKTKIGMIFVVREAERKT